MKTTQIGKENSLMTLSEIYFSRVIKFFFYLFCLDRLVFKTSPCHGIY